MSKCSIYHVESPISLIFGGPQASHFSNIFEKMLGIILFYLNKSACYILVMICKPSRMSSIARYLFGEFCSILIFAYLSLEHRHSYIQFQKYLLGNGAFQNRVFCITWATIVILEVLQIVTSIRQALLFT